MAVGGLAWGVTEGLGVPLAGRGVLLAVMGVAALAGCGVALACWGVRVGGWEAGVGLDPLPGLSADPVSPTKTNKQINNNKLLRNKLKFNKHCHLHYVLYIQIYSHTEKNPMNS